jgi:hypothetical protein
MALGLSPLGPVTLILAMVPLQLCHSDSGLSLRLRAALTSSWTSLCCPLPACSFRRYAADTLRALPCSACPLQQYSSIPLEVA